MSAPLKGKTIAFAGPFAMNQGKRDAVVKALMAGATVSPSINKNVDIVFKGDAKVSSPSRTEIAARNQGAKVLSASSFLNFVKAGGAERMKKVASAMNTVARKPAAVSPVAVRQQKLRAQVATTRVTRAEKKAAIAALNKKVAMAAKKAASYKKGSKAVPEVTLSAIYADKTDAEIEKMEQEAATYGPMPWQKGSKFQKKHAKRVDRKNAKKVAATTKPKKTAAVAPTAEVAAPPATAATTPAESATITCSEDSNTITFTPSKGMTVKFSGDFDDFCKMAAELANTSGSLNHPLANTAKTAEVEASAKPEAPAAEKTEEKSAEPVAEKKATSDDKVMKEVKKLATSSAPKKAASAPAKKTGLNMKKFAAVKKVAGRARKVVTSKTMNSADPQQVNLKKKTISFTGTFFQLKRIGLQALATKAGAFVSSGLGKDLDLVVIGADAAHKKKQAKALGVPFITEKAFIASCKK